MKRQLYNDIEKYKNVKIHLCLKETQSVRNAWEEFECLKVI